MAKTKDLIDQFIEEKIQVEFLENVMGERYGSYAKYIIQDRAIPDVRDGLKPVQRRILYAMNVVGMVYGEPYKKSARIVGEVIGKYHPHGDSSVYEALVRMSQDFKINVPLIDMHGNNGSIDGDGAAAMRYTEARLSLASMYLLKDIDKKTVQFIPNYDDSEIEPVILPAKFPNLLVNGSEGISAGYATYIPPHNINETINLTIAKIKNPKLTYDEAFNILPGPDFPTGGIIQDSDDLKLALETGRGRVVVRCKYKIEDHDIIVSEIPYSVNKAQLVKKIDTIASSKKIDGIVEVRDESDKEGLRIVIETRKESNPDVIMNYLLKNTDLQYNINYNMIAIVDRSPKLLGVLDIIDAYIQHQKEVITNRSYFELDKAKKRLHILEGFHKLSSIVDEVVQIVKNSENKSNARENIMNAFGFTELQAEAIVTLQLYRLSRFDVKEFEAEKDEIEKKIKELNLILSNESALKKVIISELEEINQKIVMPRKSVITKEEKALTFKEEELIIHEDVHVIITKDGYIKKLSMKSYQASIDVSTPGLKEDDEIVFDKVCNTLDTILLFTSEGQFINLPVYKIPDLKYKELGAYIGSFFEMVGNERIVSINHFKKDPNKTDKVLFSTKLGKVKTSFAVELFERKFKKGICMKLQEENDELLSVSFDDDSISDIVSVSKFGYILKYNKDEVPVTGLKAGGVKSINLKADDEVIYSSYVYDFSKEEIMLLTNRGGLKRIFIKNILEARRSGRGTPYLKTVKSNPYYFISGISTNPSKYKDTISIIIKSDSDDLSFSGLELQKDTFENGIPIITQNRKPLKVLYEVVKMPEYESLLNELKKERAKLNPGEESQPKKAESSESLLIELSSIIEKQVSIYDFIKDEDDSDSTDDSNLDPDELKDYLF